MHHKKRSTHHPMLRKVLIALVSVLGALLFITNVFAQSDPTSNYFGSSIPGNLVSKKMFAEGLATFTQVAPVANEKCFKDLSTKDPTTPYVCALKKQKVFIGGTTTKFNPTTKVTWETVIKSLCRAQKWPGNKSYTTCFSYAQKNGLLPKEITAKTHGKRKPTYSALASYFEKLTGTQSGSLSPQSTTGTEKIDISVSPASPDIGQTKLPNSSVAVAPPIKIPTQLSFTPQPFETIGATFFTGMTLSSDMPNHFYQSEVYTIEGELHEDVPEVFAFLCKENESCVNSTNFVEKVVNKKFKIPVVFKNAGNFQLGIIPGLSGQSRIEHISVLPEIPSAFNEDFGVAASNLSATYNNGETTFSWDGRGTFTRLSLFQENERVDYLFRQHTNSFAPPSKDFAAFKKGSAGWQVDNNKNKSPVAQINLTVQDFRKVETKDILVKEMREVMSPGKFTFRGQAISPVSKRAAVTLPNGKVEEINFATADIPKLQEFTIEKEFTNPGTYIFEVNNPEGSAVVNVPIYVATGLPLLPDFFSLNPAVVNKTPLGDLATERNRMLALINKDRTAHGLRSVTLDEQLNGVAQGHSNNMLSQNFFAHTDPAGKSPNDRRKAAGITTFVRENLGKAPTPELVEAGLMRSPVHRDAILDPEMKRVGIGIAKSEDGYLLVTQNYSGNPLTNEDMVELKNQLLNSGGEARLRANLPALSSNAELDSMSDIWSGRMLTENFSGGTAPNGETLSEYIRSRGINTSAHLHIVKTNDKSAIPDLFLKQRGLLESSMGKIGIGLKFNQEGDIFMTTIYTP